MFVKSSFGTLINVSRCITISVDEGVKKGYAVVGRMSSPDVSGCLNLFKGQIAANREKVEDALLAFTDILTIFESDEREECEAYLDNLHKKLEG